jgi:hypothetical protein
METNRPAAAAQRRKIPPGKRCRTCGGFGIAIDALADRVCGACDGSGRVQPRAADRFAEEIEELAQWLDGAISSAKQNVGYYARAAADARKQKQPMTALSHDLKSDVARVEFDRLRALREQWWL